MNLSDVLHKVKENLSKDRYKHTLRVIETAKKLAEVHDVNIKQVELASALHDYAKCEDKAQLKQAIVNHQKDLDLLNYHYELWHAYVGVYYAEDTLGIKDQSILNAIKYHTTGRAGMDKVELIVFIADFIEPARQMPGVDKIRKVAKEDLYEAALLILKTSIPYLISIGAIVYPGTVEAYNDLIKLKGDH